MRPRNKLELTWVGKDDRPRLEPRILLEDPHKSYHAPHRVSEKDIFDNRLIHGDNLLALRALEQDFSGEIKFVYIDPPFNTGQAFEHYDDGVEHSQWLGLMTSRIEVIRRLLRDDGVLFVHLDNEEVHYMKVVLDEVFGRPQFLGQIAYERSGVSGIGQGGAFLVNTHEYILAYSKNRAEFRAESLDGESELEPKAMKRYNQVLVSPGDREQVAEFVAPSTGEPVKIYRHSNVVRETISLRSFEKRKAEIEAEFAQKFEHVFRLTSIQKENEFQNRIIGYCGDGFFSADYLVSRGKREGERTTSFYSGGQAAVWLRDTARLSEGRVVRTAKLSDFWAHSDIPKANLANEGGVEFRRGKKPETLLRRLISLATKEGDWVLDSFAGSGTTGAVAHKMKRRWVMIELGEHCHTHALPRLKRVANGEDDSGISKEVEWAGGGGFRYYTLAPSLLEKDQFGNWVISKEYNAGMLAEAMCKLEGFQYAPSDDVFWQHGHSTEHDFIYVTTQTLTRDQIQKLSDEVGPTRSLLLCCGAFRVRKVEDFANLTIKKIPKAVMAKCEWGKDDYSLQVETLSDLSEEPPDEMTAEDAQKSPRARRKALVRQQELSLFAEEDAK